MSHLLEPSWDRDVTVVHTTCYEFTEWLQEGLIRRCSENPHTTINCRLHLTNGVSTTVQHCTLKGWCTTYWGRVCLTWRDMKKKRNLNSTSHTWLIQSKCLAIIQHYLSARTKREHWAVVTPASVYLSLNPNLQTKEQDTCANSQIRRYKASGGGVMMQTQVARADYLLGHEAKVNAA